MRDQPKGAKQDLTIGYRFVTDVRKFMSADKRPQVARPHIPLATLGHIVQAEVAL
jgi:hypothetical protein